MREGRPSHTSTLVAFLRALSTLGVTHVRDFSDPFAARLLPAPAARALAGVGWLVERRPEVAEHFLERSRGALDVVPLRSRAIDVAWLDAHRDGVRQLVLLGAGLDARAYRLPALEGTRVLEVDHPSTQAAKRRRARSLSSPAAWLGYVPLDLSSGDLAGAVRAGGLRDGERSFWIWEGVTHYLPPPVTAATLARIASVAPAGSRLAATYAEPGQAPAAERRLRDWFLGWAGEPWLGLLERARMARLLADGGWRVLADEGLAELAARFSDGPCESPRFRERVVLAERA